jgi:Protein of unknown function (DUF3618)
MTARKPTSEQTAASRFDDPQELRREIEHTRQELGDTVEALAHKLDVKARAQDTLADIRQRAQDGAQQAAGAMSRQRLRLAVTVGVAFVLAGAIWWWR